MCGPRRRSDEGCVKSLTPHWASSPKSELRHLSVSVADFFCCRLIDGLSLQHTKPRRLNPATRSQGPDGSTDLESN
eukprot:scaffold100479_cov45-Phaeocystis_antarctica.AAC.1